MLYILTTRELTPLYADCPLVIGFMSASVLHILSTREHTLLYAGMFMIVSPMRCVILSKPYLTNLYVKTIYFS